MGEGAEATAGEAEQAARARGVHGGGYSASLRKKGLVLGEL